MHAVHLFFTQIFKKILVYGRGHNLFAIAGHIVIIFMNYNHQ